MVELWIKDKKEIKKVEERAYQRCMQHLEAEKEAHALHLEILQKPKEQPQPVSTSLLNSREWEKACLIYRESDCIEEFLSIFERLCDIHKIPEDKWMPILLTKLTGWKSQASL